VQNNPDIMIAARFGSPLILGVGENEWFVASDASAFLEYTRQVMLQDFGFSSFWCCHFPFINSGVR
jgi:glucosamine--fructose-6-phosphate aminotransferase (isomerizing)